MSTKEEILKNSANQVVEVTKTSLQGSTKYTTVLNDEGKEYSELEQWMRVISEYKLIKNKVSKLSRKERDYVERVVDILVEANKIILNEDYSLKSFYFNGQEVAVPTNNENE